MLRDDDHEPSFVVKDETGQWYEHGLRLGGNVIDFGRRYWPETSFSELLQKIVANSGNTLAAKYAGPPKRAIAKTADYGIFEIKELGYNALLMNYLESRGIAQAAEDILKNYITMSKTSGASEKTSSPQAGKMKTAAGKYTTPVSKDRSGQRPSILFPVTQTTCSYSKA